MEAAHCSSGLCESLGDFDRYFSTLIGIKTPTARAYELSTVKKTRRGQVTIMSNKVKQFSQETKLSIIDALISISSYDFPMDKIEDAWRNIIENPEVAGVLDILDAQMKNSFNQNDQSALFLECIELSISEVEEIEQRLSDMLSTSDSSEIENALPSIQIIYGCLEILRYMKRKIERSQKIDNEIIFLQFHLILTLAKLHGFCRSIVSLESIYLEVGSQTNWILEKQAGRTII